MALKGTLRDFGLADIFQLIGIQRKTGVLRLKNGEEEVLVSFLSGGVVSADASVRALEDRLGSVLVKSGKITERQLNEALKIQKAKLQRLGKILVEQKVVSSQELSEALTLQVTQIVHHLFRWRNGEYDFSQEETIDYDRDHFTPIPADNILMEGARMIDEWPIIERRIPNFGLILRRKAGAAEGDTGPISVYETDIDFGLIKIEDAKSDAEEQRVRLSQEEAVIYRLVDGRSTVQDVIDRSEIGEFETCRILYELMSRDLVEEGLSGDGRPAVLSAPPRHSVPLRIALLLLPVLALVSTIFCLNSPLSPLGRVAGRDPFGIDRIKVHLSQARIGRIDQALRVFHLDRQAMATSLESLVREGFLSPKDLVDPWGRPYQFELQSSGYLIRGLGASGTAQDSLSIWSQFVGTDRLAIEGGVPAAEAKAAPWP